MGGGDTGYILILYTHTYICMHGKSLQLCATLCDPLDCSPTESSVHEDSLGQNTGVGDFPGGPVVKTPCSQCRGSRFDPWSGN